MPITSYTPNRGGTLFKTPLNKMRQKPAYNPLLNSPFKFSSMSAPAASGGGGGLSGIRGGGGALTGLPGMGPSKSGMGIDGKSGAIGSLGSSDNSTPQVDSIVAPEMVTMKDAYEKIKDLLPIHEAISDLNTSGINKLEGFGNDYYDNLSAQAQKRLNEQYFGKTDSLANRLKQQMNQRGLIGSGIESRATTDLFSDFGGQLADYESQLSTMKAQNDLDISKQNRQFDIDTLLANKDIEKENLANKYKLSELGLGAAGDEAERATKFLSDIFESQVKLNEAEGTAINDQIEIINSILSNTNIDPYSRDQMEVLLVDLLESQNPFWSFQNPGQKNVTGSGIRK